MRMSVVSEQAVTQLRLGVINLDSVPLSTRGPHFPVGETTSLSLSLPSYFITECACLERPFLHEGFGFLAFHMVNAHFS